jgi:hypothetical protein
MTRMILGWMPRRRGRLLEWICSDRARGIEGLDDKETDMVLYDYMCIGSDARSRTAFRLAEAVWIAPGRCATTDVPCFGERRTTLWGGRFEV